MRDGYHPEYHDDRFHDDGFEESGHGYGGGKPRRNGFGSRNMAGVFYALRGLIEFCLTVLLPLGLILAVVFGIVWIGSSTYNAGPINGDWPESLLPTQRIEVPAPAGWPDLPMRIVKTDGPVMVRSTLPLGFTLSAPPEIPAPPGWTTMPLDGRVTYNHVPRPAPLPVFENFSDQPTAGAKAKAYEVVSGPSRPLDELGRRIGAPTRSLLVTATEWGDSRVLPLAFFSIDDKGEVIDAMPSLMEWIWLVGTAFLVWGIGTIACWIASHEDQPFGLPYAGYESDAGRRYGSVFAIIAATFCVERTGTILQALVLFAALVSFGSSRAARARWLALAMAAAAGWLAVTTPMLEPIPALSMEYGALGIRAWDMLALAAVAVVALGASIPWRGRGTHVTVHERPNPLVQDVRVVGKG